MYPLILITSLFFLSCAAQAPASGGPKDIKGPEIIMVSPIDRSTHIDIETKIIIEFNENIDPTSVQSSISILNFEAFTIKSRRNKVIIEPQTTWPQNKSIEVNISRRIRDFQKNIMARGYQFIFTTGESIPQGSIVGRLENYTLDKITKLLLFTWPISDSSIAVVDDGVYNAHGCCRAIAEKVDRSDCLCRP